MAKTSAPPIIWKYWYSQIDDRTTIICADAAGQRRQQHDLFDTMAGSLDGPPAHWGCRSSIGFWTEGQVMPDLKKWAQREMSSRASANPERFLKDVIRNAKMRPPGQRQLKGRVRHYIRTTRQQRKIRDLVKHVEQRVSEELRLGRDTQTLHRNPVTGKWNLRMKDRPAMHNRLIARADKSVNLAGKVTARGTQIEQGHEAIIMTGLPGAGKTSALRALGIDTGRFLAPNADDFKVLLNATGRMPRWKGLSGLEKAGLLHEESSYLAKRLANRAMRRGTNMILETTGGDASVAARIAELKAAGYNVKVIHVDVDVWTSTGRAVARAERSGRFVPVGRIES
ncbi:MAG: hypothetical protein DRH08_06580, partial [Deltaproteobacteria bacterium]